MDFLLTTSSTRRVPEDRSSSTGVVHTGTLFKAHRTGHPPRSPKSGTLTRRPDRGYPSSTVLPTVLKVSGHLLPKGTRLSVLLLLAPLVRTPGPTPGLEVRETLVTPPGRGRVPAAVPPLVTPGPPVRLPLTRLNSGRVSTVILTESCR